jgi:hypothetical protein
MVFGLFDYDHTHVWDVNGTNFYVVAMLLYIVFKLGN